MYIFITQNLIGLYRIMYKCLSPGNINECCIFQNGEDNSDFEDTLKEFGRSVPALTSLSLSIESYYVKNKKEPLNFELLRPNLPRLTHFYFKQYIIKAKRLLLKH